MILAYALSLALASDSASSTMSAMTAAPRILEVNVSRTPSRYGGVPVYLQGVDPIGVGRFVVATDEDPTIKAPAAANAPRFGVPSRTDVSARAMDLVMNYTLSEGESDSSAFRHVLARHGGGSHARDVAKAENAGVLNR